MILLRKQKEGLLQNIHKKCFAIKENIGTKYNFAT
jgi:hypothetical protein